MTPSIHLVRLRVSGWKGIKDEALIEFGDSSWLIHGANEAGKSSLFSALRFALFEHSARGGAFSDGWVNNDSTEAVVEVGLKIGGAPYTIVKRRDHNKKGTTRLFDGIGDDRRERPVKNKDADLEILELIGASARKSRDSEAPSSWGILAWLLAPQSINTVHDARKHSTQALGLGHAISPEFQRVREQVAAFDAANFGKNGAPLKASALYQCQAEVTRLEEDAKALVAQRARFDDELQKISRLEGIRPKRAEALAKAEEAYDLRRESDVDFATDEAHVKTLAKSVELAQSEEKIAATALATLKAADSEVAAAKKAVQQHARSVRAAEGRAAKATSDLERVEHDIETATQQRELNHATVEANGRTIRRLERATRRVEIAAKLEEIAAIEQVIAGLAEDGELLTDAQIDERVQLASDLEQAESLLANLASERGVTVAFDGQLDATWLRDGVETSPSEAVSFASDLEIRAQQFTLTVSLDRAAGSSDWVEQRRALADRVAELAFKDAAALRAGMKRERRRTRVHAEAVASRARLGDVAQLAFEAAQLEDQADQDSNDLGAAARDERGGGADVATLKAEVIAAQEDNRELATKVEKLRKQRTKLARDQLKQATALEEARAQHTSAVAQLDGASRRRDEEIAAGGLLSSRQDARDKAAEGVRAARLELRDAKAQLDTSKGAHADELQRLRRVRAQARKDLTDCETDIQVAERNAVDFGGQDLQAREIALGEALQSARQALARERRQSEAKQRLSARLRDFMVQATDVETAPIKDRVQRWLRVITEGHWRTIEMDSHLEVTRLKGSPPTIDGETMGSAGLRQVIHALTRLAVAVKIYEDGRAKDPNYPAVALVMDESQSHVDTVRVGRLMRVFNDEIEAGRVQVMALSHRQDEFLNLHARSYDISRRQAYDLDGM